MIAAVAAVAAFSLQGAGHDSIRIQLVTGGHEHDISFYKLFEAGTGFKTIVNPHPRSYRKDLRQQFDVLVLYDAADTTDEGERDNLRRFLESGKGLVVLHHAIADNQQWPWWYEEVVGGRYLLTADGEQPASTYKHDVMLTIRPVAKHPITDGIGTFQIFDEVYSRLWLSPNIQMLLVADQPDGKEPIAWIGPYKKSRVVYIELGHGPEAYGNPIYRKLVRSAVFWAAGKR